MKYHKSMRIFFRIMLKKIGGESISNFFFFLCESTQRIVIRKKKGEGIVMKSVERLSGNIFMKSCWNALKNYSIEIKKKLLLRETKKSEKIYILILCLLDSFVGTVCYASTLWESILCNKAQRKKCLRELGYRRVWGEKNIFFFGKLEIWRIDVECVIIISTLIRKLILF